MKKNDWFEFIFWFTLITLIVTIATTEAYRITRVPMAKAHNEGH